jgi:hypothetical protein
VTIIDFHFCSLTRLFRSLNTQQPAAGLWLCDIRSAAAVEGALVFKSQTVGNSSVEACSIVGIILCRLQHAATQTLWPLMLPLHLLFRSLLSALPLPSFFTTGLNSLSFPTLLPPLVSQAGVVRLTMSTLPAQWASAVVVGDGDFAFTGSSHSVLMQMLSSHVRVCVAAAHFFCGAVTGSSAYVQCSGSGELVPCTLAAVATSPWDVARE